LPSLSVLGKLKLCLYKGTVWLTWNWILCAWTACLACSTCPGLMSSPNTLSNSWPNAAVPYVWRFFSFEKLNSNVVNEISDFKCFCKIVYLIGKILVGFKEKIKWFSCYCMTSSILFFGLHWPPSRGGGGGYAQH
jgi:hypothetical protein